MIEDTSSGSFDYGITPFGRAAFAQDDRAKSYGFFSEENCVMAHGNRLKPIFNSEKPRRVSENNS
jgi:hypothetical protein